MSLCRHMMPLKIPFFCVIVDAFSPNLYYTCNICMCWAPTMYQALCKSLEGSGEQNSPDIWSTNKPKIASMRGTRRDTGGCLIDGLTLCALDPHPLFSISMVFQILPSQPHWPTGQTWILFSQPPKLALSLFSLINNYSSFLSRSNIYISEKPFLSTSPE